MRQRGLIWLAVFALSVSSGHAQSWKTYQEQTPLGLHAVTMVIQKHEFALQVGCDETAQKSRQLHLQFFGPALPRLYGEDGQTETLMVHLTAPSTPPHIKNWEVYYFDGGLGDQAWIGKLAADDAFLHALAGASDIELRNLEQELIYSFPANGTSAGVSKMQRICGISAN